MTFKQALDVGGNVRKGEHGTKVYFVKQIQVRDKRAATAPIDGAADDVRTVGLLREYTVFNVAQCENLPARVVSPETKAPRNRDARDATADEFLRSTGAKARLDRDLSARFGARAYAAEELVAEICAAFLCAEFSIDGDVRHAGYIATWAKLLRDDPRAFFTACSKAQAAAEYLRGFALAEPVALAA